MIAQLRKDKIVQYDSIYVSFYGFFFILLTTRSVEHENSNKKGGWNCNGNKGYRKPKGTILQEYTIQGHWHLWACKTPDEDEQFSAHDAFLE